MLLKVFVTGVTGQLGHDVMIELVKQGYQVIGSGSRVGDDMKVFVTGVGGQLGHDCVNELVARGHEAVGSDIQQSYSDVNDGTPVVTVPYVQLNITNQNAVKSTLEDLRPDVIIHCAVGLRWMRRRTRRTKPRLMQSTISVRST